LGDGVTVGPFSVIHDGVVLGDRTAVGSHCILGEPTAASSSTAGLASDGACVVGPDSVIRSHSILYQGVETGAYFETGHRATIREGSVIGTGVRVGTLCDLQGQVRIGDHCRLHSNVFVAQVTVIESFVWLFPGVMITNDPHPPSDTCTRGATIREFAVVAARATLMPGVEIGASALVAAASLVTHDVPPETVVMGSPATAVGSVRDVVCKHGELDHVYPWPSQFRRGFLPGALPDVDDLRPETDDPAHR
jgi:acetyltransferase-like isoleucine patch superfamily enzyme